MPVRTILLFVNQIYGAALWIEAHNRKDTVEEVRYLQLLVRVDI